MSMKRKCETCKRSLYAAEVGARVDLHDGTVFVWCLPCWDDDPDALTGYQMAQIATMEDRVEQ